MKYRSFWGGGLFAYIFFMLAMGANTPVLAEKPVPGKTYDKSNYEEIQDYLIPPVLMYVKQGEFLIKVGKPFARRLKQCDAYLQLSAKNQGKYDVDQAGILIDKATGKVPAFVQGNPFPSIDVNDPKIALKIMENASYARYRAGTQKAAAEAKWVGLGGYEREIIALGEYFFFQNRTNGQVPNPNNFLQLTITGVEEPFDLRGSTSMAWTYNDQKEDTSFAYVPMLRRVRRTSAASRSDPFMGGDGCMDDAYGYAGKNAAMTFKFLGEKEILAAVSTTDELKMKVNPDGTCTRTWVYPKAGFQTKGWQGAPWAPVDAAWIVRPVWVIEMFPKDPFYNYGRQVLYIDKDQYAIFNKEVYDRAGTYWKNIMVVDSFQWTENGEDFTMTDCYHQIDSKSRHAGVSHPISYGLCKGTYRLTLNQFGPENFTASALMQRSK